MISHIPRLSQRNNFKIQYNVDQFYIKARSFHWFKYNEECNWTNNNEKLSII